MVIVITLWVGDGVMRVGVSLFRVGPCTFVLFMV